MFTSQVIRSYQAEKKMRFLRTDVPDRKLGSMVTVVIKWLISPTPRCSMYGIFTNISPKFMVNVGRYFIHGADGTYKWGYYLRVK